MDFIAAHNPPIRVPTLLPGNSYFSGAEYTGLIRDGLVQPVSRSFYSPGPTPPGSRLRARALAEDLPQEVTRKFVLGRLSAAWIHGCASEPELPVFLVDQGQRIGISRSLVQALWIDTALPGGDVSSMGGLMVTSPERTVVDLILGPGPTFARDPIRNLIQIHHLNNSEVMTRVFEQCTTARRLRLERQLARL